MTGPAATVVVVARDRWAQAPRFLRALLEVTDRAVPMVVVDAGAPATVSRSFDALARAGRIRVVRRGRFLSSNEARNAGADGLATEWVAFVENDVTLSPGWLGRLLAVGEQRSATSVYPAYLNGPCGVSVHGLGADLQIHGEPGRLQLQECLHHVGERWETVAPTLSPVERLQAEPHAVVVRRSFLEQLGGLDEGLLSWFEHLDLALHHRRLGASSWLVPDVTCTYHPPPPLALSDLGSFAMRWSRQWLEASLRRLCEVWGLDPGQPEWDHHERYRRAAHRQVPTRSRWLNEALRIVVEPWEGRFTRRWARRVALDRADLIGPNAAAAALERSVGAA